MRILSCLVSGWTLAASAVIAQDSDLTILVEGDLFELGGLVEVLSEERDGASTAPREVTVSDRFARIRLPYPTGGSYNFRFRPGPEAAERDGAEDLLTRRETIGSCYEGDTELDYSAIWVFPYDLYAAELATQVGAAWGETVGYAAQPPGNRWGARALMGAFGDRGDFPSPGLICSDTDGMEVCKPDPADRLLMEALWWRALAEGRLERLRHDALRDCYDGGGLFGRPERCDPVVAEWPEYEPAD